LRSTANGLSPSQSRIIFAIARSAGDVVTAAANRNGKIMLICKSNRLNNIGGPSAADHHVRMAIDHCIPDRPGDATEFRKQAEECQQFAETARSPDDWKFWLKLTKDWLNLADTADNYSKKRAHQSSETAAA
jgi:hypothetical protein